MSMLSEHFPCDFGIDMRSDLCKTCIHTKVCYKDKNLVGDIFVAGNPMITNNKERYEKYLEWGKEGFPCEDYLKEEVDESNNSAE